MLEKLFPSLNEDKNCKTLLDILRENVDEPVFLYIDIGSRYIPNMKTCSVYHWHQKRNNGEVNAVHYIMGEICENIARIRQKV